MERKREDLGFAQKMHTHAHYVSYMCTPFYFITTNKVTTTHKHNNFNPMHACEISN